MPELVREKGAIPKKNVIQGMDLVYSQTKSGHPEKISPVRSVQVILKSTIVISVQLSVVT